MPKLKQTDNIKMMLYMPRRLHRRLRLALARTDKSNRSAFICQAVEKALEGEKPNGANS